MAHSGQCLECPEGGTYKMQSGSWLTIDKWDLIIAHPPCTYLSNVATRHHSLKNTPENRIEGITLERIHAMDFFMRCIQADAEHIAVENPVGIMNTAFRSPDQIIHPFQFAESEDDEENYVTKRTCLWLKNLPRLKTNNLKKPDNASRWGTLPSGKARNWCDSFSRSAEVRSKTFHGIARAMAQQWSEYLLKQNFYNTFNKF